MFRIAFILAALVLLASCASAPQVSPAARSELAPTGKLRVGINFQNVLLTRKDPATGEAGGIALDLAHELGRRLGVPVEIVPYPTAGHLADSVKTGAWDVAFLAGEAQRADVIAFTAPYAEIETTYLVPAGSPFRTVDDVDRDGVRIAVGAKGGPDLALSRIVKRAQIVRAPTSAAAAKMFVADKLDALAGLKPGLVVEVDRVPGSRILEGRFSVVGQAVGTHKGRDAAAKYLSAFVEDIKGSGLVAKVIEKNGIRGLTVAPVAAIDAGIPRGRKLGLTVLSMRKLRLVALLLAASACGTVFAQQYPARSVRFISPFPPGGGNDTLSRIVGDKLSEQMGQRIIVENRPGANTIVGTEVLAKSPPDGYTIALLPNTFSSNPSIYPKLPYDTLKDFTAVGQVAQSPQMLLVHPSVPAKTLKELLALAKSTQGGLSYGTSGNGSVGHLATLLLTQMTGVPFVHVAYKGTALAVADLMGGHIPLMMSSMLGTLPHVRAGRLRMIAITSAQRAKAIPEVPTIAESGVPGYADTLWYGFVAPARTPDAIIRRLNTELATALKNPDVVEKLSTQAVEPFHTTPEQFGALIRSEHAKWAKVIKAGVIKTD